MQTKNVRTVFVGHVMIIMIAVTAFAFSNRYGLDSFEIHLNNKLVVKNYVNQPLNLRKLELDKAKDSDELQIRYKHCNETGLGTNRSLVVKDQKGKVVKKWEFEDVKDAQLVITVKALRQLENSSPGNSLSLHYMANELPKAEMIASLSL